MHTTERTPVGRRQAGRAAESRGIECSACAWFRGPQEVVCTLCQISLLTSVLPVFYFILCCSIQCWHLCDRPVWDIWEYMEQTVSFCFLSYAGMNMITSLIIASLFYLSVRPTHGYSLYTYLCNNLTPPCNNNIRWPQYFYCYTITVPDWFNTEHCI